MPKYYPYPFAVDGVVATVPDPTQSNGSVSYQSGYTLNYTLNPLTNPFGFDFPLDQNNQITYDITNNIQQYWQNGVPEFITTVMNLGSPYPYSKYARCRYNAGSGYAVYESLIDNNTDTPPSSNWLDISLPIIKTWAGATTPVDVQGDGVNITLSGTNNQVITFQGGSGPNAYPTIQQIQQGTFLSAGDVGTVNNIVLNPTPAYVFPTPGLSFIIFSTTHTNTGPVTVTINGNGPIAVEVNPNVGLIGGEIRGGGPYILLGSDFGPGSAFILVNPSPATPIQRAYYTCGPDVGTVNALSAAPLVGGSFILHTGAEVTVYPAFSTTSTSPTLNWSASGVFPIFTSYGAGLVSPHVNAMLAGYPSKFIINQTLNTWMLLNPYN